MSGYKVVGLPTLTVSSGATASPVWTNLDDAQAIGVQVTLSTAPGFTVKVEITATGTNFFPLLRPFDSSAGSPMVVTSSGLYTIAPVTFQQMRFDPAAASTGALTITGTKQILV